MRGFRLVACWIVSFLIAVVVAPQATAQVPPACDIDCNACMTPGSCEASQIGCVWDVTSVPPCISYDDALSLRLKTIAARMLCILSRIGPYVGLFALALIALKLWVGSDEPQVRTFAKQTLWNLLLGIIIVTGVIYGVTVLDPGIDLDAMCEVTPSGPAGSAPTPEIALQAYITSPTAAGFYTPATDIEFSSVVTGGSGIHIVNWYAYSSPGVLLASSQSFTMSGGDPKLGVGAHTILLEVNDSEGRTARDDVPIDIGAPGAISFTFSEETLCG